MFFLFWTARAVTVTLSIFCSIKHVLPDFIRLWKFFKKSTKNGLLSCHNCTSCVIRTGCSTHHRFRLINVLHRFFRGWTQPWLDQSMNMRSISMLWLHMNIGWSGLKNMLFIHYLSIRNNIYWAIHFRFLLLIWFSSAVLLVCDINIWSVLYSFCDVYCCYNLCRLYYWHNIILHCRESAEGWLCSLLNCTIKAYFLLKINYLWPP